MKSATICSKLLMAAAVCAVLAGCNAVEDVRNTPGTALPTQLVVIEGTVYGLGIRRSIGLTNGTAVNAPVKLVQGVVGEPIGTKGRETRFSFGALPDGSTYNIVVKSELKPFGKICVVNNGTGTVHYSAADAHQGAPQNIEVVCTDDPAVQRYDIQVATPDPFRSATGAKVTLLTEEGVFEQDPKSTADGDPNFVWFRKALITVPTAGVIPFQNIVTATTEEGSTTSVKLINRCAVTNYTFASPAGTGANVSNVAVGACKFSIGGDDTASGGAVRYSRPVGITSDTAMSSPLVLELKYPNGNPVPSATGPTTEVTINSFGGSFTFPTQVTSGAQCPVTGEGQAPVPCEVRGFYEVVVKTQPSNERCIVASTTVGMTGPLVGLTLTSAAITNTNNANTNLGGAANLYILDESLATGTLPAPPANYNGLRVYCRALPASNRQLTGTYQLTSQTTLTAATSVVTGQLDWSPAPSARRQFSHMLTLFADGTFLFGAHTASDAVNTADISNHAEQGFYDYAPGTVVDANNVEAGNKLRFTVHVDGNTGGLGPPVPIQLPGGLSSAEGARTVGSLATGVKHQVLARVVIGTGTPRTITGRFGPDGSPASTVARDVVFTEPENLTGQMTGNWISEDHLRFWSYNFDSTFGFHAGVSGYPNIQNNCFQIEDFAASSGQYVPSTGGAAVYCSPLGSVVQSNLSSVAHSPTPLLQTRLPGWQSWMPGSELGGGIGARSPSPVYFKISTPGTFLATADATVFPSSSLPSTSWCTTEILGVRGTQNGELSSAIKPLYFCRQKAP